jgi:DNA-binding phage protein
MAKKTVHDAVVAAFIPANERDAYDANVDALLARNRLLALIEDARKEEKISKKELALRAGLDAASVRRLLSAETANPTSETIIRLFSALHMKLDAVRADGTRLSIV